MVRALAFDVFGTLFDVSGLREVAASLLKDPEGFVNLWRSKQLEFTFLLTLMGRFATFSDITRRALASTAHKFGVRFAPDQVEALMRTWEELPIFPDVLPTLKDLHTRYVLAVLSNGETPSVRDMLRRGGLDRFFPEVICADEVGAYKPSPRVYARAADRLALSLHEILLVSSNAFDVLGAKSAGMAVCWVNRDGGALDDLGIRPDLEVRSMVEIPSTLVSWSSEASLSRFPES